MRLARRSCRLRVVAAPISHQIRNAGNINVGEPLAHMLLDPERQPLASTPAKFGEKGLRMPALPVPFVAHAVTGSRGKSCDRLDDTEHPSLHGAVSFPEPSRISSEFIGYNASFLKNLRQKFNIFL